MTPTHVTTHHPDAANRNKDHHPSLTAAEANYSFVFAMPPDGSLPPGLTINRAFLRQVTRHLRPYRSRWTNPGRHLAKQYSPFKGRFDELFDRLADDFEDLLELWASVAPVDTARSRMQRAVTDLNNEAARRSETKYYALPVLLLYTYEAALILSQLPGHTFPSDVLSDLSAYLVYPNDDPSSFELRGVYRSFITESGQQYPWHVLIAVRLGRSQRYRCPLGTERQAVYLQLPRSVTAVQRSQHPLTPRAGETCHLVFI